MRKANFEARIRKIEIANRVLHDSFAQTLRVTLDEVELTNENLVELRQFKPSEFVRVEIIPCQLTILEAAAGSGREGREAAGIPTVYRSAGADAEEDDLVLVDEEDKDVPGTARCGGGSSGGKYRLGGNCTHQIEFLQPVQTTA